MGLSTEEENEAYTLSKDEGAVAKAVQEFASLETTTDADRSLLTALLASHSVRGDSGSRAILTFCPKHRSLLQSCFFY